MIKSLSGLDWLMALIIRRLVAGSVVCTAMRWIPWPLTVSWSPLLVWVIVMRRLEERLAEISPGAIIFTPAQPLIILTTMLAV